MAMTAYLSSSEACTECIAFQIPVGLGAYRGPCSIAKLSPRSSHRNSKRKSVPITRCSIERPERYDATDWFGALRTLPKSVVLRRIRGHIIANGVAASIVCIIYEALLTYYPDFVHHFNITPLPHTFMTTAMSLLLVFRSNAAYVSASCKPFIKRFIYSSKLTKLSAFSIAIAFGTCAYT